MMGVHNCRQCQMLCTDLHPLCMWCRRDESVRVKTFIRRAEASLEKAPGDSERISPIIVRQVDGILARHNRQEARARRRRRPIAWGRLTGFFLVGLGCLGLAWGCLQVCMWFAQGVVAWMGGK